MEKTIKRPRRITEEEFFEYLESLKPHQISKDFIMSFYQRLKQFDEKRGKYLTYESFGFYPQSQNGWLEYSDHAKMLFFTIDQQNLFEKNWEDFKQQEALLIKENASSKVIEDARQSYLEKQKKILNKALDPIGLEELFRFQIVNFVDEIVMGKDGGAYDLKNRKLTICNEKVITVQNENSEIFWHENIIAWHELVHLMELKSYKNGKIKYLTPLHMEGEDNFYFINPLIAGCTIHDDGKVKYNEEVITAYKKGEWILNEILTELFSFRLFQTPEPMILSENTSCYAESPILSYVFFDKEKQFEWNTNYLKFSSFIEIANAFYEHQTHILSNPTCPPTWYVIENLRDMFASSKPSKKVLEAVNKNLAEIGVEESSEKFMFQKFVLILGRAVIEYKNASEEDAIPFNPHFQLSQTLLLDMYLNDFKEKAKQNHKASMQNEVFVKNLLRRHLVLHYWLCLPNKNIGSKENPVWAKRQLCPSQLFAMYPDNLLLEVWADATEKMYDAVSKNCPSLLNESFLMGRTHKYLKKTKNINPEK